MATSQLLILGNLPSCPKCGRLTFQKTVLPSDWAKIGIRLVEVEHADDSYQPCPNDKKVWELPFQMVTLKEVPQS